VPIRPIFESFGRLLDDQVSQLSHNPPLKYMHEPGDLVIRGTSTNPRIQFFVPRSTSDERHSTVSANTAMCTHQPQNSTNIRQSPRIDTAHSTGIATSQPKCTQDTKELSTSRDETRQQCRPRPNRLFKASGEALNRLSNPEPCELRIASKL
jgi:hypothetical protein